MSEFAKLQAELDVMAKALSPADKDGKADDKKIVAAAEEKDEDRGDKELDLDEDEEDAKGNPDKGKDGKTMAKAFTLKLEDGTEVEAMDGSELIKSLMARVEGTEAEMVKALGSSIELLKAQGEMIKALQADVTKLGNAGKGRKAVITVAEKVIAKSPEELAKSQEPTVTTDEFFAKALNAQAAGRVNSEDIARAESYLNRGMAIPKDIVARVYADVK